MRSNYADNARTNYGSMNKQALTIKQKVRFGDPNGDPKQTATSPDQTSNKTTHSFFMKPRHSITERFSTTLLSLKNISLFMDSENSKNDQSAYLSNLARNTTKSH
jgi:hypothetical protein